MRFPSEKSIFSRLIFSCVIVLLAGLLLVELLNSENLSLLPVTFILVLLSNFLWMWFDTGYTLDAEHFRYSSGPFRGKIALNSIREIQQAKGIFIGLKIGLGTQGLVILFNKFDEIYISPKDKMKFIQEVCLRNPAVKISGLIPENPL
jgi:hypothetical protein